MVITDKRKKTIKRVLEYIDFTYADNFKVGHKIQSSTFTSVVGRSCDEFPRWLKSKLFYTKDNSCIGRGGIKTWYVDENFYNYLKYLTNEI